MQYGQAVHGNTINTLTLYEEFCEFLHGRIPSSDDLWAYKEFVAKYYPDITDIAEDIWKEEFCPNGAETTVSVVLTQTHFDVIASEYTEYRGLDLDKPDDPEPEYMQFRRWLKDKYPLLSPYWASIWAWGCL